jgi:large subunit ribosomal protein L29
MTKATHLREMSSDQLHFTLTESQKELFRLRFQAATEKLDAPSNLRKLRREIARIYTVQSEREKTAAPKAAAPETAPPKTAAPKTAAPKIASKKTAAPKKS